MGGNEMNSLNYLELKEKSLKYSFSDLLEKFGFIETLNLARLMLINDKWDETLQEYATHLLEQIRKTYPIEWNSNWKYDALLGYAYDITFKYDERYIAYKRALSKVSPPPPQLQIALAGCCWAPGRPPITEEEAILLVKEAIAKIPYIEGVELLRGLYKSTGNINEQQFWDKYLEENEKTGSHLTSLDQI